MKTLVTGVLFILMAGAAWSQVFVDGEVPTGLVNGTNARFTLANVPNPSSLAVYVNGLRKRKCPACDYTANSDLIIFNACCVPGMGSVILVDYTYGASAPALPPLPGPVPGTVAYLFVNGATLSWGNITTGGSGALDCVDYQGACDVLPAIMPFLAGVNVWTGVNDFSEAAWVAIPTGTPLTSSASCSTGQIEYDTSYIYICTGPGAWMRSQLTAF